jgi:splicing factor 3B subunit 2
VYHVGIEKIRRAVEEANEQKKVAAKQRDRVAPKMGRMDVDYQVLHDAFFKWQTKPPLSGPGADSVLLTCHVAAMASS